MSPEDKKYREEIVNGAGRLHSKGTRGEIVYPEEGGKPLAEIQENIFLHSHGDAGSLGGMSASELKTWLEGLGLSKDFSKVIVLAGCETAKDTLFGFGRSLAKELFDLLVADGYKKLAVQGMANTMIVHKGEIRIIQDDSSYDSRRAALLRDHDSKKEQVGLHELNKFNTPESSRSAKVMLEKLEAEYEQGLDDNVTKYTHLTKGKVTLKASQHVSS